MNVETPNGGPYKQEVQVNLQYFRNNNFREVLESMIKDWQVFRDKRDCYKCPVWSWLLRNL